MTLKLEFSKWQTIFLHQSTISIISVILAHEILMQSQFPSVNFITTHCKIMLKCVSI